MAGRAHLPAAERRAVSRLHSLLQQPGLLHGSLHVKRSRCGKSACHCATGERHESHSLWVVEDGRQVSVHVPADWVPRIQEWLARDREVRALLQELSGMYLERLRRREGG